eukprot:1931286-Amphidinium_carterae.1
MPCEDPAAPAPTRVRNSFLSQAWACLRSAPEVAVTLWSGITSRCLAFDQDPSIALNSTALNLCNRHSAATTVSPRNRASTALAKVRSSRPFLKPKDSPIDGMSAVVKYVVTIGASASVDPAAVTPPSRKLKYSLIFCNVPFRSFPGCLSARRAILLVSLKPPRREPDDDRDDEVEPRLLRRRDRPLDLFLLPLAAVLDANS